VATITIVGLGPGPVAQLTNEAEAVLLAADKIFFRTAWHCVHDWLNEKGKHVVCFDRLYGLPWKVPGEIYDFIVGAPVAGERRPQRRVASGIAANASRNRTIHERTRDAGLPDRGDAFARSMRLACI
jgi:hypothetical protein